MIYLYHQKQRKNEYEKALQKKIDNASFSLDRLDHLFNNSM
jgi:hypothetical protein